MPDFGTQRLQEPNKPIRLRIASIGNKLRILFVANRLRILLIGGGILSFVMVAFGVGLGGQIAFQLDEAPWTMNADGSNLREELGTYGDIDDLAWAPDLKKIVFTRMAEYTVSGGEDCSGGGSGCTPYYTNRYSYHEMAVTKRLGSYNVQTYDVQLQRLNSYGARRSSTQGPAWSPDGKMIAFSRQESDLVRSCDLYVMNADGSETPRRLTTQPEYVSTNPRSFATRAGCDTNPAWSPSGEKIAFASSRTGNDDIYVMNVSQAEGGMNQPQRLTDSADDEDEPSWSPDGTEIAFTRIVDSNKGANTDIYKVDADGSGETRLTHHRDPERSPTWSPEGEQIAYVREDYPGAPTHSSAIYILEFDGSDPTLVRKFPGKEAENLYWR